MSLRLVVSNGCTTRVYHVHDRRHDHVFEAWHRLPQATQDVFRAMILLAAAEAGSPTVASPQTSAETPGVAVASPRP